MNYVSMTTEQISPTDTATDLHWKFPVTGMKTCSCWSKESV